MQTYLLKIFEIYVLDIVCYRIFCGRKTSQKTENLKEFELY